MIQHVQAIEFVRTVGNGRTKPAFIVAENNDEEPVELIAKLAAGCFEGVGSLAVESISACLAGDLGIRVPEPYFVHMLPGWIDSIIDPQWAALARQQVNVAFGSQNITGGFTTWQPPGAMSVDLVAQMARALTFDCGVENADRRPENANCLRRGEEFYLIDHELCFPPVILGASKPWVPGGLQDLERPGKHIFVDALRGRHVNWAPIVADWRGLSDDR